MSYDPKELCKVIHDLSSLNTDVLADKLGISRREATAFGNFMSEMDNSFCGCKEYWRD